MRYEYKWHSYEYQIKGHEGTGMSLSLGSSWLRVILGYNDAHPIGAKIDLVRSSKIFSSSLCCSLIRECCLILHKAHSQHAVPLPSDVFFKLLIELQRSAMILVSPTLSMRAVIPTRFPTTSTPCQWRCIIRKAQTRTYYQGSHVLDRRCLNYSLLSGQDSVLPPCRRVSSFLKLSNHLL